MRNHKAIVLVILIVSLTTAFARNGSQEQAYSAVANDVLLLASLINSEAGSDSYLKQVAVGAVVINRMGDAEFPDTLAGVIYQPGAFAPIKNGNKRENVPDSCVEAALDALNGWDPVNGALYYWKGSSSGDKLATTVIEEHTFGFITESEMQ